MIGQIWRTENEKTSGHAVEVENNWRHIFIETQCPVGGAVDFNMTVHRWLIRLIDW